MQVQEDSDERLMERYQEGDVDAFNRLFARYEGLLYNFFLRRLASPEDCEDLYQKTFMKLHRARLGYDPTQPFRPWFFTIAYNVYRDELRGRSRRSEVQADGLDGAPEPQGGARTGVEESGLAEQVRRAVDSLPEAQRQVVLLSKFEGLAYEQISSMTGQTENAVKQMAHRAFVSLREQLGELVNEGPR